MARDADVSGADLAALVGAELERPVPPAVAALAAELARRAGDATAAVLFYGSALRDDALDGVLDFYVLTDRPIAWPGSRLTALAGRLIPPNVGYLETAIDGVTLRTKYAVMTLAQFRHAMAKERIDTTLWARFSQPVACIHARGETEARQVRAAVTEAVVTAARWAAALGPVRGTAADFWRGLFQRTYAVELRVERSARADDLVARDAARYSRLLPAAWEAAGLAFSSNADGVLAPTLNAEDRAAAERRWRRRRLLARPLNLLRLFKAASTFDNAIDYVAWKVERHSGYRIEPTEFQRRHPLLAAPSLYLKLRARGVLR
ncbi:MAG: hypothetical protein K8R60_20900 [Burkholderiales bacterium]|nr:hypothetical protein [Burkholderiales bacterium]